MSAPRYLWRQLNEKQRAELLLWRRARGYPWHSPPHRPNFGHLRFLISASCFEHRHYIGHTPERMDNFSRDLVALFAAHAGQTFAWCVLPNHYHALVEAPDAKALLYELGLLQGRTAPAWNGEEQARGRKVFFRAVERAMRSDRHYWATLNYVHHNPVRTGTWRAGCIGRGAAQRSIWPKQVLKRRRVSGRRIRCATTERIGTNRGRKAA